MHSLIIYRERLNLTTGPLHREGLVMNKMAVLHQNSGVIWRSIPDAQEISQNPRDVPRDNGMIRWD